MSVKEKYPYTCKILAQKQEFLILCNPLLIERPELESLLDVSCFINVIPKQINLFNQKILNA